VRLAVGDVGWAGQNGTIYVAHRADNSSCLQAFVIPNATRSNIRGSLSSVSKGSAFLSDCSFDTTQREWYQRGVDGGGNVKWIDVTTGSLTSTFSVAAALEGNFTGCMYQSVLRAVVLLLLLLGHDLRRGARVSQPACLWWASMWTCLWFMKRSRRKFRSSSLRATQKLEHSLLIPTTDCLSAPT